MICHAETLNGYYHVFSQILKIYGISYKFFTDNSSVFSYKKKNSPSFDEDTHTQFAYACKQLDVKLEPSSVPRTKGQVERLNRTLQSRLSVEFRLAEIARQEKIYPSHEKSSLEAQLVQQICEISKASLQR